MSNTSKKPSLHVPSRRVCAVCALVLDHVEGYGWKHPIASEQDHPAIPVLDTEVEVQDRCDFCYGDTTSWVIPARDFQVAPQHGSAGDWAACEECAQMIQKDAWNQLLTRVVACWEHSHREAMLPPVQAGLRSMYRKLRKNITGAPRRIEG